MKNHEISPVETLIIPAAGAGTRLYPITRAMPKEMVRVVDKPIAYYLLAEAYLARIRHVIFVVHADNTMTKAFFEGAGAEPSGSTASMRSVPP